MLINLLTNFFILLIIDFQHPQSLILQIHNTHELNQTIDVKIIITYIQIYQTGIVHQHFG